jgi:hypothetical protein
MNVSKPVSIKYWTSLPNFKEITDNLFSQNLNKNKFLSNLW